MSNTRVNVVKLAFKRLDADGSGIVNIDDIRGNIILLQHQANYFKGRYSAKNHPDVRSGRKSEDEILAEFLDTFEQHHAIHVICSHYKKSYQKQTGDPKGRDAQVTFEEFVEYYNNISSSIDDDRYFEQMIRTAWNLDNTSHQKGWRNE